MRGVVSLAAALSIPLLIAGDQPFPFRNLILFITFIVIIVTLVLQGLTLPWVIRKVKLEDRHSTIPEQKQEKIIQKKLAQISMQVLEEKYANDHKINKHVKNLHERLKLDQKFFEQELDTTTDTDENSLKEYQTIYLDLLEQQRSLLSKMNLKSEFDEDLIRKHLGLIDLEEFKVREKRVE